MSHAFSRLVLFTFLAVTQIARAEPFLYTIDGRGEHQIIELHATQDPKAPLQTTLIGKGLGLESFTEVILSDRWDGSYSVFGFSEERQMLYVKNIKKISHGHLQTNSTEHYFISAMGYYYGFIIVAESENAIGLFFPSGQYRHHLLPARWLDVSKYGKITKIAALSGDRLAILSRHGFGEYLTFVKVAATPQIEQIVPLAKSTRLIDGRVEDLIADENQIWLWFAGGKIGYPNIVVPLEHVLARLDLKTKTITETVDLDTATIQSADPEPGVRLLEIDAATGDLFIDYDGDYARVVRKQPGTISVLQKYFFKTEHLSRLGAPIIRNFNGIVLARSVHSSNYFWSMPKQPGQSTQSTVSVSDIQNKTQEYLLTLNKKAPAVGAPTLRKFCQRVNQVDSLRYEFAAVSDYLKTIGIEYEKNTLRADAKKADQPIDDGFIQETLEKVAEESLKCQALLVP